MTSKASAAGSPRPLSTSPLVRSFTSIQLGQRPRVLNLLLLDFAPGAVFAGVKTAFEAATLLGTRTSGRVRVVLLRPTGLDGSARDEFVAGRTQWLIDHFGGIDWRIVCDDDVHQTTYGVDDVWLATHWLTAHALDLAAREGSVNPRHVIYLIQDYEPDHFASPADQPAAESTYVASFIPVINSRQVAGFLASKGFGPIDNRQVFAPQFDRRHLMRSAAARQSSARLTVFFYGRPSKPRNMFDLGVATLRVVAAELADQGAHAEFVMAGEAGPDVDLGHGFVAHNRGILERDDYFAMIARIDVGLTLQATPHPSHLPFDLAISGAIAVTNEVDGSRNTMHPRIIATEDSPEALSLAVVSTLRSAPRRPRSPLGYLPVREGQLGGTLQAAVSAAVRQLDPAEPQQPTPDRTT